MIARYSLKRMDSLWSMEKKFQTWLQIEILVCEAWAQMGMIPGTALEEIKKKAHFSIERIDEIEKEVKHDVIAFLTSVSEFVGENARYIHKGLTSSDILDTSLAVLLKEASDILIEDMDALCRVLKEKAYEYRTTLMIGRTHGIHAEPVTFGLKMALWYAEMKRCRRRMMQAKECISVGKISGAVGTYDHCPPSVELYVCEKLGLRPDPISTQIIQRDRHAEYLTTLAIIASCLDKFAVEIRHLQRTEVREAEENFSRGQKGSSAMPHKRNPVKSEQICGLARVIRAHAQASLENVALWHERDISHSSVERIICPDSTTLLDYMLETVTSLVSTLIVYPEKMKENVDLTGGLIYSQKILLQLTQKGISRETAYRMVQEKAMKAWRGEGKFKELLCGDKDIQKLFDKKEIEEIFSPASFFQNIDYIFDRVFEQEVI
ncbi:MAG: adenylosuccinate lyase [bacterium]